MRLCFSPTSPYVRKVRACAITREIDRQIELVPTDANASLPEFVAINPLSKVPALVTDDGVALFDSPVICEYLDSIGDALPMFPDTRRAALAGAEVPGDGRRHSRCVGAAPRRDDEAAGRGARGVDRAAEGGGRSHAGCAGGGSAASQRSISVRSRSPAHSGYLDFRFAAQPWRPAHPKLAAGTRRSRRTRDRRHGAEGPRLIASARPADGDITSRLRSIPRRTSAASPPPPRPAAAAPERRSP